LSVDPALHPICRVLWSIQLIAVKQKYSKSSSDNRLSSVFYAFSVCFLLWIGFHLRQD